MGFVDPPEMSAEPDYDGDFDYEDAARERELMLDDLADYNEGFSRFNDKIVPLRELAETAQVGFSIIFIHPDHVVHKRCSYDAYVVAPRFGFAFQTKPTSSSCLIRSGFNFPRL
jgi:hypothetical protein